MHYIDQKLQVAVQELRYGVHPTAPIATGGLVVNSANVDQVLAIQKKYPGLRGAE